MAKSWSAKTTGRDRDCSSRSAATSALIGTTDGVHTVFALAGRILTVGESAVSWWDVNAASRRHLRESNLRGAVKKVGARGVFERHDAVWNIGGMRTVSPLLTTTLYAGDHEFSEPCSMMKICSLGWLCSGTTQPFVRYTLATVMESPWITWRAKVGLSCSFSMAFHS